MRLFSFTLSLVVFFISLYFFVIKITDVHTFNDGIYVSLLCTLMAICVVGVLVNAKTFRSGRNKRIILFISNLIYRK